MNPLQKSEIPSPDYINISFPRYPTPPPDYDDDFVAIGNDRAITIADSQMPAIPSPDYDTPKIIRIFDEFLEGSRCLTPDYDSSAEGNSDVTRVIGDDISVAAFSVDSDSCDLNVENEMCYYRNPAFSVIEDGCDFISPSRICNTADPQVILYPSRLAEVLPHLDSPINSVRLYVETDYDYSDPTHRIVYCGVPQICSWITTFLFMTVLMVLLVRFHPDSPAVWVTLVAFIILIFVGLANCLPSKYKQFFCKV